MDRVELSPGTTELSPWMRVVVRLVDYYHGLVGGKTAIHEAAHIVADPHNVKDAGIDPGPGYLGYTRVFAYKAIQFMAAKGWGCDGYGHDARVVASQGDDPDTMANAAKSYLGNLGRHILGVAAMLESKIRITGSDALLAMDRVDHPEAVVQFEDSNGVVTSNIVKSENGSTFSVSVPKDNQTQLDSKTKEEKEAEKAKSSLEKRPFTEKLKQALTFPSFAPNRLAYQY